jgi:Tfp pilus assembly protein PilE
MAIFPHRNDWRSLLALVSETHLEKAQAHYATMASMLERKLQQASERNQPTVRSVLENVRMEQEEVERELLRRQQAPSSGLA